MKRNLILPPESECLTGQLLIAMPSMLDSRFTQTVVYVCAYSEEGAMGIVLNRPLARPRFSELIKKFGISATPPARQIRLCAGGPVDHGRGFVLHTSDWETDGTLRIDEERALTSSLDVLKVVAEGGGPRECVLALGYAGWEPGQLDLEIHQNTWLTAPADDAILFDSGYETKWRRALAKLGIDPAALSGTAGRA
ncbi:MAG TPA: YqgE/AlgH family protein [Acetobacteraceae bacterium]|nr:YqgE/AlgH family protein [Acetobacteraceae bacterium]